MRAYHHVFFLITRVTLCVIFQVQKSITETTSHITRKKLYKKRNGSRFRKRENITLRTDFMTNVGRHEGEKKKKKEGIRGDTSWILWRYFSLLWTWTSFTLRVFFTNKISRGRTYVRTWTVSDLIILDIFYHQFFRRSKGDVSSLCSNMGPHRNQS